MDPASIAAALVGAQVASAQLAVADEMLRMNATNDQAVVKLIDAAQQNINQLANVAAGVGGNLNISA
jgi:hypothetical protein